MMKLSRLIIICLMICAGSAAGLEHTPDVTLLWNKFIELKTVGNFAVGLSNDGLSVLAWNADQDAFVAVQHLVLPAPAKSMKLQGALLIVRHQNDDLSFINTLAPLPWERLGTISPDGEFYDFAYIAGDLYLSRWFDGIDKYSVVSFQNLTFEETERSAVVATQLESAEEHLYALDMYNGILKYDLSFGFGSDVKKLLVNKRPFAFSLIGGLVFISMNTDGAIVGKFNESFGEELREITGVPSPDKVLPAGKNLLFLSPREVHVFDADLDLKRTYLLEANLSKGDTITIDHEHHLLLPGKESGITKFDLLNATGYEEVLFRPGPINSVLLHNDQLFTGGVGNPLEMYKMEGDSLLAPQLLRDTVTEVTDLTISGYRLYSLYSNEKKILTFYIGILNELILSIDSFSISIEDATEINVYDLPHIPVQILTAVGRSQIEVFSKAAGAFEQASLWTIDNPIADVTILNGLLYVTDRFGGISGFEIQNDLSLLKCSERDLTGTGWAMESYDNQLLVFTGNTLAIFSDCLELDTIVHLPSFVLDAEIIKDTLYTIGPDRIAKYDLSSGLPDFIESGGLGGSQLSVNSGVIATTDGSSMHVYFENVPALDEDENETGAKSVSLYENYPNPFNLATTIQFELLSSTDIKLSVYNMLGQRIRLLAEHKLAAGNHSISWDGKNESGREAASGVYFYKLETESETIARKMLLIK